MPEFGQRQHRQPSDQVPGGAPGKIKKLVGGLAAIALIPGSVLAYRTFHQFANRDPLLEKRESFREIIQKNESSEDPLQEYPSLDTREISIAFGTKVYKIPRNYLVDLDRSSADPKATAFEIRVLLPDLTPRKATNVDSFVKHPYRDGFGKQVYAIVRGGQQELDWSERKDQWARWCTEKGRGTFRPIADGYKLCEADSDLFLKDTPEGPLIFACRKATDKNPHCTLAEPTGAQHGVLNLEFSREYVYWADEIRRRFRSMLDSFADK